MPGRSDGAPTVIDDVDRRLIDLLQTDGRLSMAELARRANVSRANAYQRVGRLQERGVIRGFTARVDSEALGLGVAALIMVDTDQHRWRDLRADLLELPGVEYLALTTGEFDLVLRVRVADVHALRDVVLERLQSMDGVRSTRTVFILEEADPGW
jgi:DNA-binding Lrp family transcriptional regulator